MWLDSGNVQFGQLFDRTVPVDVECNKRMVNDENRVHLLAIAFVFIAFCCVSCWFGVLKTSNATSDG